ncbi:MAG: TrkA C-terminal domain-containing protein, partial [Micromonosporaceae bacterium]
FIVQAGVTGARRIYEIIFVVVAFSVIVQGGTVPVAARRLKIPLRTIEPEPWSLGIRFQEEPEGLHRCTITPGSAADGTAIGDLPMAEDAWISLVIRGGRLVPAHAGTVLQAADEIVVLAPAEQAAQLSQLFTMPQPDPPAPHTSRSQEAEPPP